jgi:hypothetical protein
VFNRSNSNSNVGVTPWLSDRDLALANVKYVLNAAGNLAEDFRPAPDGLIVKRAHQVLGEAVDLLERIVAADDGGGVGAGSSARVGGVGGGV